MSSSHSLNRPLSPLLHSPKKSSISSIRSGESDGERKLSSHSGVGDEKELKELCKKGSKKDKKEDKKHEKDKHDKHEKDKHDKDKHDKDKGHDKENEQDEKSHKELSQSSTPEENKLTKKGSVKELVKRDSFKHISNRGEQVPKKFISTWKMACDKTKDRTKELLKKWRTVPEDSVENQNGSAAGKGGQQEEYGWSVHVWTTWVKRFPSEDDKLSSENDRLNKLTGVQCEKLSHFFSNAFDMDRDDIISLQDLDSFTERLRHFTDWSTNSGEYLVLQQVQQGFVETFLVEKKRHGGDDDNDEENKIENLDRIYLSLDEWLLTWSELLENVKAFYEFPVWLQYFARVLFQAINTSGNGRVTKEELRAFYISVMGFQQKRVDGMIDTAFKVMTSNQEHTLNYSTYRLIFSNFFLGRFPNGPGQFLFGFEAKSDGSNFPIDYSALNTPPQDLEQYNMITDSSSNRRSIVV